MFAYLPPYDVASIPAPYQQKPKMAGRKKSVLAFLPIVFSAISFILVVLLLLSGTDDGLSDLFFLKVNISGLSVPSVLSGSEELRDLSAVSGTDYVGDEMTPATLGLADEYTVSFLSSCALRSTGPTCSEPRVGFWFNPGTELRLDAASPQASTSPDYRDALAAYSKASYFVAFSFVFSAALLGLSAILGVLGATEFASVGIVANVVAILAVSAALFLLAGNAAATHVFRRLSAAFNGAFADQGLSSSLGIASILLGWLAFALAAAAATAIIVRRGRRADNDIFVGLDGDLTPMDAGILGKLQSSVGMGEKKPKRNGGDGRGVLGRIPLPGRHKYVPVNSPQPRAFVLSDQHQSGHHHHHHPSAQQQNAQSGFVSSASSFLQSSGGGANGQQRDHDDHDFPARYEGPRSGDLGETTLSSVAGPRGQRRQMDMAYEPYSSAMR